jgi:hypothetical protein
LSKFAGLMPGSYTAPGLGRAVGFACLRVLFFCFGYK